MNDIMENLGAVIAWKWGEPHTRHDQEVEIEGVGAVDWGTLEAAYQEWLDAGKPRGGEDA